VWGAARAKKRHPGLVWPIYSLRILVRGSSTIPAAQQRLESAYELRARRKRRQRGETKIRVFELQHAGKQSKAFELTKWRFLHSPDQKKGFMRRNLLLLRRCQRRTRAACPRNNRNRRRLGGPWLVPRGVDGRSARSTCREPVTTPSPRARP